MTRRQKCGSCFLISKHFGKPANVREFLNLSVNYPSRKIVETEASLGDCLLHTRLLELHEAAESCRIEVLVALQLGSIMTLHVGICLEGLADASLITTAEIDEPSKFESLIVSQMSQVLSLRVRGPRTWADEMCLEADCMDFVFLERGVDYSGNSVPFSAQAPFTKFAIQRYTRVALDAYETAWA